MRGQFTPAPAVTIDRSTIKCTRSDPESVSQSDVARYDRSFMRVVSTRLPRTMYIFIFIYLFIHIYERYI